ncbi:MAG: inactive transglutaminase family protein [Gammaproteobacteria bacterium]
MKNTHLYVLVAALVLGSLGLFAYKHFQLGFPLFVAESTQSWEFEARVRFDAGRGPIRFTMHIPSRGSGYVVTDESFFSGRFGLQTRYRDGARQATWAIRSARGRQTLIYRGTIQAVAPRNAPAAEKAPPPPPPPQFDETELVVARALVERARESSADTESLVGYVLTRVLRRELDPEIAVLVRGSDTREERLETAVKLLALAGVRADILHGIPLAAAGDNLRPVLWLEAGDRDGPQLYDGATGERVMGVAFVTLWHGSGALGKLEGGRNLDISLLLKPTMQTAIAGLLHNPAGERHWIVDYSLFNLPPSAQAAYRILLTIPLGVFILVLMRNVVGFKTFGTFMPVLIALAFRGTEILAGVIFFSIIVSLGLLVRFYLEHLKLVLVPRLGAVLIVVVLLMTLVTMLSYKLGIGIGLSVALFPMVVMTMVIERMAVVWEERGAAESIRQGVGSLVVAILAYGAMNVQPLVHLIFLYPELLLLVLAATLLLGRYTGYRLLELRRFRALAGDG